MRKVQTSSTNPPPNKIKAPTTDLSSKDFTMCVYVLHSDKKTNKKHKVCLTNFRILLILSHLWMVISTTPTIYILLKILL